MVSRRDYLRRSAAVALAATTGCLESGTPGTDTATNSEPSTTGRSETETESAAPVVWRSTYDGSLSATPVITDGRAYAGSKDGSVRRHSLDSGTAEWTFDADGPVQDLARGNGTVLVVSGTNEFTADQTLVAVDAASGAEQWRASPGSWWLELLAVADGTVYVATADDALRPEGERLYALAVCDGRERWSTEIGDPREVVLTKDSVYVSVFGRIYAIDRDSGRRRWKRDVDDLTYTTPAVVDGTLVYASTGQTADQHGALVGLDAGTGEERWQFDEMRVTSTAARDSTLYVGGSRVAALDPVDGAPNWQTEASGFVTAASVTDGRVYAGGDGIRAYEHADGNRLWAWAPDPAQGGVFVAGTAEDRLLVDAYHDAHPRNQYKFAVNASDGTQAWAFEDGTELTDLAVGGGTAVVGGKNGVLYGLSPVGVV